MVADVQARVALSLHIDFEYLSKVTPGPHQIGALNTMLDQLVSWSSALSSLRAA